MLEIENPLRWHEDVSIAAGSGLVPRTILRGIHRRSLQIGVNSHILEYLSLMTAFDEMRGLTDRTIVALYAGGEIIGGVMPLRVKQQT